MAMIPGYMLILTIIESVVALVHPKNNIEIYLRPSSPALKMLLTFFFVDSNVKTFLDHTCCRRIFQNFIEEKS